jgi:hypothetical protein
VISLGGRPPIITSVLKRIAKTSVFCKIGPSSAAGLCGRSGHLSENKVLRNQDFSYTNPPPAARSALVFCLPHLRCTR